MADLLNELSTALADRYRLERELGRGGMAIVYLARDLKHDRPVALKVLLPDLAASLGSERFLREVRLTARLEHPHILPILDSGEAAGLLWYTMPYVRGENLRERLSREIQLPVEIAVDLTRQVASALDYAHREGVVHRDLKPENILLANGQARVADFGIAKAIVGMGEGTLTDTGLAVGTPAYMSPEQASGGPMDTRTDVYALGCVLYEMLAGEPPFTGRTPQAVIAKRMLEPVPHVRTLRDNVPAGIERALVKAMARVPADRFSTAAEFAQTLAASAVPTLPSTVAPGASATSGGAGATQPESRRITIATLLTCLVLALAGLFAWDEGRQHEKEAAVGGPPRLAVLPFENLGRVEDEYFAEGIADELRGKLASLPGLRVIASSSANQYKDTPKTLRQIGDELGVRYLLTAKVQWVRGRRDGTSRVRVSPELIEAADETTRWQESFDAVLSDIFTVQAQIASRVAVALDLALSAGGRAQLAERPTESLEAYEAYLKAEAIAATGSLRAYPKVIEHYQSAITLDSGFARAWSRLTQAQSAFLGNAPSEALRIGVTPDRVRSNAGRAVALAPGRAEAHLALGYYYGLVEGDSRRALAELELGLRSAPNDADLLRVAAFAELDLGRWDTALAHLRRAAVLDPRSSLTLGLLGSTLLRMRRYGEAREMLERAESLSTTAYLFAERITVELARGDLAAARTLLRGRRGTFTIEELGSYVPYWAFTETDQKNFLSLRSEHFEDPLDGLLTLARIHADRGDARRAMAYADSAVKAADVELQNTPSEKQTRFRRNEEIHAARGVALAYLGRTTEAMQEGERAVASRPVSADAMLGAYLLEQLAHIYILVGEHDKALDQLESLLEVPSYLSPGWLELDPWFNSLRSHPGFQRLLARKH